MTKHKLVAKSFEASHDGVPHFLSTAELPPPTQVDTLADALRERDRYRSVLLTILGASLDRKNPSEFWKMIQQLSKAALEMKSQ